MSRKINYADNAPVWRFLTGQMGLYTLQSLIGGLVLVGLGTYIRQQGASLDNIGLLSLTMLPWVLKFMWSGRIERWRYRGSPQRSSSMILLLQSIVLILLASLAYSNPVESFFIVLAALLVMVILNATVDIVADGYMIERLQQKDYRLGNLVQVGGGYCGAAIGGGVFLIIAQHWGWFNAIFALTGIGVILLLTFFTLATQMPIKAKHTEQVAQIAPSLLSTFKRPEIKYILLFITLCQLGLRLIIGLIGPFLVDAGFSLSEIGWLTSTYGFAANLAAIICTSAAIKHWSVMHVIRIVIMLQLLCYISLLSVDARWLLQLLFITLSASMAASFVALYTQLMLWTSQSQPGVDFSIFQSVDMLIGMIAGMLGATLAQYLGYNISFALAALAGIIFLLITPYLLKRIQFFKSEQSL